MILKSIVLVLFCTCVISAYAQNKTTSASSTTSSGYSKTANGLEYKILKKGISKKKPELGGYITFWFRTQTLRDSIIDNQFEDSAPINLPTPESIHKPSIEEGFYLLAEGDSAVFLLNADSLYTNTFHQPRPAYIQPQSTIKMIVKMGTIYSKHDVDSLQAAYAAYKPKQTNKLTPEEEIFKRDSALIQAYLNSRNLKGIATKGGAYVVILRSNTASKEYIHVGETIRTTYVGKLIIDGTEFDRSPQDEYFSFMVGQSQVIRGWDEGFLKLKHAEKALILIPSRLAYGQAGAGASIPPNAPLVFEVEVK